MMVRGASMAPRQKMFPGLAMDMHSRSPSASSASITTAMTAGNARLLWVTLLRGPGRKKGTSEAVERDRLLASPSR